jgi:hypothetical protein
MISDSEHDGLAVLELEYRQKLMADYGHSWRAAAILASYWRWSIEVSLSKPLPLVIVTGA